MKVVKIDKKTWVKSFEKLADTYQLFGPGKDNRSFTKLEKGELPPTDCFATDFSPKNLVNPQSQIMCEYSLDEKQEDHHILKSVEKEYSKRAIIGIRPCDAKAFLLVQKNFDTPDYKDPYWIRAYESITFIGYVWWNFAS